MGREVHELSIGLPVFNGERFLSSTLDSLLGQTFANFELIVSDNASTDATEGICREYQSRDSRIRYVRHAENLGAVFNWNYVARQAQGSYFKWASANDYCDATFCDRCIDILREREDIVLCHSRTYRVKDNSDLIDIDSHDSPLLDERPADRFIRMVWNVGRLNILAGVIRRDSLLRTRLIRLYPHGDKPMMAELALLGKFWLLDEPLFYRRQGIGSTSVDSLSRKELRGFLDTRRSRKRGWDLWSKQLDFIATAAGSDITMGEKMDIVRAVLRQSIRRRRELWQELRTLGHD